MDLTVQYLLPKCSRGKVYSSIKVVIIVVQILTLNASKLYIITFCQWLFKILTFIFYCKCIGKHQEEQLTG